MYPQLTKDGMSECQLEADWEKPSMQIFDAFIDKNLSFDLHKFLSAHLFFTFASFGLLDLDSVYQNLSIVAPIVQEPKQDESGSSQLLLIKSQS